MVTSESMLRYTHSEKGKATRQRWLESHAEERSEYIISYLKERRRTYKEMGVCIRCQRRLAAKGFFSCLKCLEDAKKNYRRRKNEEKQKAKIKGRLLS